MIERDGGEFGGEFGDRVAPKHGGGEDVGLVHAGDAAIAAFGALEGEAGDTLYFGGGVDGGIASEALGGFLAQLVFTEIDVAGQFADNFEVAAFDALGAQRRDALQRGAHADGAQINEQAELLAQGEEAAFRTNVERELVPGWAADGAEKDRVRRAAAREGLRGERHAAAVNRLAAEGQLAEVEGVAERGGAILQDLNGGAGDLGADAVAREDGDILFHRSHSGRSV